MCPLLVQFLVLLEMEAACFMEINTFRLTPTHISLIPRVPWCGQTRLHLSIVSMLIPLIRFTAFLEHLLTCWTESYLYPTTTMWVQHLLSIPLYGTGDVPMQGIHPIHLSTWWLLEVWDLPATLQCIHWNWLLITSFHMVQIVPTLRSPLRLLECLPLNKGAVWSQPEA